MVAFEFSMAEDNERTITVNVVSQFLLGMLLIPKLRETAVKFEKEAVLTFTGSFVHWLTKFPERKEEHVFEALAKKDGARLSDRYVSRTLNQVVSVPERQRDRSN
jgi:retinol dehydrogenase-12